MLVKYLGTVSDSEGNFTARSKFLENGLFRITQPKFLNDKGSEARFYPYFDKFSPADIEYAKKRFRSFNIGHSTTPSNEELINFYLEPAGRRYTVEEFPTLLGFTEYTSIEEYKKALRKQLNETVKKFNNFIVEAMSCHVGVLSLSRRIDNDQMWTHYADEGRGVAISFNDKHPFFETFGLREVSYNKDDRASITYYKGAIRINGEYAKSFQIEEPVEYQDFFKLYMTDKKKYEELVRRLLFTKASQWAHEMESRLIIPLIYSDFDSQDSIKPTFEDDLPKQFINLFPEYPEVCLKKIPFDAFDTLFFGYSMNKDDKERVINLVKSNENLDHLKVKQANYDIYGELEFVDIDF